MRLEGWLDNIPDSIPVSSYSSCTQRAMGIKQKQGELWEGDTRKKSIENNANKGIQQIHLQGYPHINLHFLFFLQVFKAFLCCCHRFTNFFGWCFILTKAKETIFKWNNIFPNAASNFLWLLIISVLLLSKIIIINNIWKTVLLEWSWNHKINIKVICIYSQKIIIYNLQLNICFFLTVIISVFPSCSNSSSSSRGISLLGYYYSLRLVLVFSVVLPSIQTPKIANILTKIN